MADNRVLAAVALGSALVGAAVTAAFSGDDEAAPQPPAASAPAIGVCSPPCWCNPDCDPKKDP